MSVFKCIQPGLNRILLSRGAIEPGARFLDGLLLAYPRSYCRASVQLLDKARRTPPLGSQDRRPWLQTIRRERCGKQLAHWMLYGGSTATSWP
eukprot:1175081-Pyramimonas_sp.AAC.1